MANIEQERISLAYADGKNAQDPFFLTIESGPKPLPVSFWRELIKHQVIDFLSTGQNIMIVAAYPKENKIYIARELVRDPGVSEDKYNERIEIVAQLLRFSTSVELYKEASSPEKKPQKILKNLPEEFINTEMEADH